MMRMRSRRNGVKLSMCWWNECVLQLGVEAEAMWSGERKGRRKDAEGLQWLLMLSSSEAVLVYVVKYY